MTIALSASNSVGVSAGINPGDIVVTDGTDKLQDGSKVEAHTVGEGGKNAQGAAGQTSQQPNQQGQAGQQQNQPTSQPGHKGKKQ